MLLGKALTQAVQRLRTIRHAFSTDSLFRNAMYLMASTAVMSVLGFVFWIFVAHLYAPADIGVASALISLSTLISNFSLLGLNTGIIRFLPSSKQPSGDINASALTVAFVTTAIASVFVLFGGHFTSHLTLLDNPWHKLLFVVLMSAVSLNSLTDAVFIANRRGEYHTIGYGTFGVVKLILPLLFIPFGATGVFGAYILAMAASLLVSYYLMRRGCGYRLFSRPTWTLLKNMRRYAFHNYLGAIVASLPAQLMPLFIIRQINAPAAAFFSMAWTMVNLLYIVPSATTQSLMAETVHDGQQLANHLKRTIKLLTLLLVPAVALAVVVSPHLLALFGAQYRINGTGIFQVFSLATFFVAITAVGITILNIERRTWGVVAVQASSTIATGIAVLWLVRFGLPGIGAAFFVGNVVSSIVVAFLLMFRTKRWQEVPSPERRPADISPLLEPYGITAYKEKTLGNGSHNATILITTPKARYVLRIYRPNMLQNSVIMRELRFMNYLRKCGLNTPEIIRFGQNSALVCRTIDGIRWQSVLMKFASGVHPDIYTPTLLADMAKNQALIHTYGRTYIQLAGKNVRHLPFLLRLRQWIVGVFVPAGYSHFDYDASNVLAENNQIVCILDFEGMRYGPLVFCIYYTLSDIYRKQGDASLVRAYLQAYQATRPLKKAEKIIVRISLLLTYRTPALLRLYN